MSTWVTPHYVCGHGENRNHSKRIDILGQSCVENVLKTVSYALNFSNHNQKDIYYHVRYQKSY